MKNLVFLFMVAICLSSLSLTGCGGNESKVIEAPPIGEEEEDPASAGMSEEEYDKAMEESMK